MRNLEDCKTEVFRRSEERIKERKRKRNRVLAWCIPLYLLLVAGGIYIRPLLEPVDEVARTNAGPTPVPDRVLGGMNFELYGQAVEYVSVTLMEGTGSKAVAKKFTDAETLGNLYGCMAMYFNLSGADAIGGVDGADGTTGGVTGATGTEGIAPEMGWDTIEEEIKLKYELEEKPADYTIVFLESTGEETVLRLYENNLYNESNGCVMMLSDAQLTELKSKLEQAVAKED